MVNGRNFATSATHAPPAPQRQLTVERLEEREVLSVYEDYAVHIINYMRANPTRFANEIDSMVRRTGAAAHGYLSNDPVWEDLRWSVQNGRNPQHYGQSLTLMRAQPNLGPLAPSDRLEAISAGHNAWMSANGTYAHSVGQRGVPGQKVSGLPGRTARNLGPNDWDVIDSAELGTFFNGAWAENISYAPRGSYQNSFSRFGYGDAYYQRSIYLNTVSFMLETFSDSLGHLRNLLARDSDASGYGLAAKNKEISNLNYIGVDFDIYPNPDALFKLSTHSLARERADANGQYGTIVVKAWQDRNANGFLDLREGINIEVEISGQGLTVGAAAISTDPNASFSLWAEPTWGNGQYEVTAIAGGRRLGTKTVTINNNNAYVEFKVPVSWQVLSFSLTTAPPSDGSEPNDSPATASVLRDVYNVPVLGRSIDTAGDVDYYRFDLDLPGHPSDRIRINYDASKGDIDAELYYQRPDGTLESLQSATSSSDEDVLTLAGRKPGSYFLKVYGYQGATNFYSIATEVSSTTSYASLGAVDPGFTWYLREANSPGGTSTPPFAYGAGGWVPVAGDWDGNGGDSIGAFDPRTATWYLRNTNAAGGTDYAPFAYGAGGWIPVVGDWDGDGVDTIGIFDPRTATWYLRNSNSPGGTDFAPFAYGAPGWIPVVGDWDGDGRDTIGVYDPLTATWYLRDSNSAGAPSVTPFAYGWLNFKPVAGDWDRDGRDSIGVVTPDFTWYLRNSNSAGAPSIAPFAYGAPGWTPIVGNWTTNRLRVAATTPLPAYVGPSMPNPEHSAASSSFVDLRWVLLRRNETRDMSESIDEGGREGIVLDPQVVDRTLSRSTARTATTAGSERDPHGRFAGNSPVHETAPKGLFKLDVVDVVFSQSWLE